MTNKLLNKIYSFICEAVKSAQEESKQIIVELRNNNEELVNKNKELEQKVIHEREAYSRLLNITIKQENKLKDKLSKQCSIIEHKDREIEKWKHQAELGSETTDRFAKQLEEKEQEYEELENDYAELEKRHNDSFEHFHTLRMICDDYKIANAELEQECEILKQKDSSLLAEKNAMEIARDEYKQKCEELKEKLDNIQDSCPAFDDCSYRQCDKHRINKLEQECEKVKNWIRSKMFYTDCENWFERFVFALNDWQDEITKQLDQLKAENETYKKMLDNSEFRVALTDVKTGERQVWRKLGGKAQKYKQALEEIEKICKYKQERSEYILPSVFSQILDIINNTK